jgi:hypothetical protein
MLRQRTKRWMVFVLLLAAVAVGGISQPAFGQKLHLVILADTNDDKIGVADRIDMEKLDAMFSANVPARQLHVVKLWGNNATPRNTLQAIGGLNIAAGQDTVMFYYSGHGAFVKEDKNDHILWPNKKPIYRNDIRNAIRRLQLRLSVVITDTCSVFMRKPPAAGALPPAEELSPLFRTLFFETRGLVDISCTKPGQAAKGNGEIGGWFTHALCIRLMPQPPDETNQPNQEPVSWATILRDTNAAVLAQHPNAEQTAYEISPLPSSGGNQPDNNGPLPADPAVGAPPVRPGTGASGQGIRFGVAVRETRRSQQHGGMEVSQVFSGYSGTSLLNPETGRTHVLIVGQHVITQINGQPITSQEAFSRAIDSSPQEMTIRVYNLESGTHREYQVTLRY